MSEAKQKSVAQVTRHWVRERPPPAGRTWAEMTRGWRSEWKVRQWRHTCLQGQKGASVDQAGETEGDPSMSEHCWERAETRDTRKGQRPGARGSLEGTVTRPENRGEGLALDASEGRLPRAAGFVSRRTLRKLPGGGFCVLCAVGACPVHPKLGKRGRRHRVGGSRGRLKELQKVVTPVEDRTIAGSCGEVRVYGTFCG